MNTTHTTHTTHTPHTQGTNMNFKSNTVRTAEMLVTPEMADKMLATSAGNRVIREWHVRYLAAAQVRGDWKLTHQGAAFDWDGHLRDGHHRLLACVESGVTIPILVTVGMDPAVFDAVDQGVNRNLADLLGMDRRIAEPLRLGAPIAHANQRPSISQVRAIVDAGLGAAVREVIDYCGTARKFFSSAPVRLAAAVSMMAGMDRTHVLNQYRAMLLADYDNMTQSAKALTRQVETQGLKAGQTYETIARSLKVFDPSRASLTKIQVGESDAISAVAWVRGVLLTSVGQVPKTPAAVRRLGKMQAAMVARV